MNESRDLDTAIEYKLDHHGKRMSTITTDGFALTEMAIELTASHMPVLATLEPGDATHYELMLYYHRGMGLVITYMDKANEKAHSFVLDLDCSYSNYIDWDERESSQFDNCPIRNEWTKTIIKWYVFNLTFVMKDYY